MKYMRTDGNSKRQDTVIDDGREAGKQSKARKQNKSMHTHTQANSGNGNWLEVLATQS